MILFENPIIRAEKTGQVISSISDEVSDLAKYRHSPCVPSDVHYLPLTIQ